MYHKIIIDTALETRFLKIDTQTVFDKGEKNI